MTIRKRFDNSPDTLPKRVANLDAKFEQERAALRNRSSAVTVGGQVFFVRDGILFLRDVDGTERPAVPIARTAPFPNNSFEAVDDTGFPLNWSAYWRSADATVTTDTSWSTLGGRSLKGTNGPATNSAAIANSGTWNTAPGATMLVEFDARGIGVSPQVIAYTVSNVASGGTGLFDPGASVTQQTFNLTATGSAYTASLTLPSTHTRAALYFDMGSAASSAVVSVWVDNVGVTGGEQQVAGHSDYLRRAIQAITGGGIRTSTTAGDIAWGTGFRVTGAGLQLDEAPDGYFLIGMPANGTVIPVHHSTARTSHTVASGLIRLNANESLWYELPLAAAAASQPARFHIVANTSADGYVIGAGWVLVCARGDVAGNPTSDEFKWADGRPDDPRRNPAASTVNATAQTVSSTTPADVPALTITRSAVSTAALFEVDCTLDTVCNTGGTMIARLLVDGTAQTPVIVYAATAGLRIPCTRRWVVTGLSSGSHVFKITTELAAAGGNFTVNATHSSLTVDARS
ncbi:hypothetical protein [Nocardioides sp. InS609-2]|uniref:hypothetical protein n=1 Tax=Nocardioides sp. InS609-2 TaxID=2760705 RepID=UPI0020BFDAA1|nr:hypothetical protein [Nocardioides sp. InS609-2]